MKNYTILLIVFLFNIVYGQKYDNNWIFGYEACTGDTSMYAPLFAGSRLFFNGDSLNIDSVCIKVNLAITSTTMSNKQGDFLFHTNSYAIGNLYYDTLENGTGLNPEDNSSLHLFYGGYATQLALSLPNPKDSTEYYLFHAASLSDNIGFLYAPNIYYSIIKFDIFHPYGHVLTKNVPIAVGNFSNGGLTACKHANGRDWWLPVFERHSTKVRTFLLDSKGVSNTMTQTLMGPKTPLMAAGQAVFSPDGTKYARFDTNYIVMYNFDRCTGLLSFQDTISISMMLSYSVCFSPNSEYLYAHNGDTLYQYDANASNIASTARIVGIYDGFSCPPPYGQAPTYFFLMQNAPEGKIYMSTTNSTPYLHVIHSPDSFGTACNFQQHAIKLKGYNAFGIPNFPNYRLGALAGSPCDTLWSTAVQPIKDKINVQIYPNPVEKELSIALQNVQEKTTFVLYDALGKQVLQQAILQGVEVAKINVAYLLKGMYFYLLKEEQGIISQGKIIKE